MPTGLKPSPTVRLLTGLSRLDPRPSAPEEAPVEWRELVRRAVPEGVAPLVYRSLKAYGSAAPPETLQGLRRAYTANKVRNIRLFRRLAPLLDAAHAGGLGVIVTKGARLAATIYPDIGLRPFADVDLIIRAGDWPGLETVLRDQGFALEGRGRARRGPRDRDLDWTFSPYYRRGELFVELHFAYLGLHIPFLSGEDLWRTAVRVPFEGGAMTAMAAEYELCYLCLHAQQHSYARLVWLTDIAELVSRGGPDWDRTGDIARREGIGPVVAHGLRLVEAMWPGTVPGRAFEAVRGGAFQRALLGALWPARPALARKDRAPMPYYTPSFFALLSRRKPLLAARTLGRVLFPPMDWIAETYDVAPGSPGAWLRYASRLAAPVGRLFAKREEGA